ncbi:hypothetical protein JQ596_23800 [Bradyrhizobium manausense]|uniref:hypothetical protein n=1 Tax=Bradyrhizobium manausense TaxID=989370 RepID=UPI001BA72090|nr:hypothetical protein [Bradyrhizobium manausense]MBR0828564.1 hypothetical protein [Bradyrhizobium manausense]
MPSRHQIVAALALSLAALGSINSANAADFPVKAVPPVADVPFFFVNDNRLTYAYLPSGTDPGLADKTAKQVVAFTHFDAWAYGTNFINMLYLKSDHADPAGPCPILQPTGCAGASEFFGLARSTFGFNQIFGTKAFTIGPLHNVSLEVGAEVDTMNLFLAPSKKAVVAGLQFAFDLPYKGFFNVAPLYYKEYNHNAFLTPAFVAPLGPGIADGNTEFNGTWSLEVNYYMDLGFLPESLQYFAISGRARWVGPKGTGTSTALVPLSINPQTAIELNSEPIRLTFDASKALWGPKYSHFTDIWVAYSYWQNKFGLDHNVNPACIAPGTSKSCTESSVYSGITVKF